MSLEDYFTPRIFRSPFVGTSERVSGASAFWALLLGPVYYWRKRAPVEALLLAVIDAGLLLVPDGDYGSLVLWLGAGLGAPLLLPLCYRRKGWTEIAPRRRNAWA